MNIFTFIITFGVLISKLTSISGKSCIELSRTTLIAVMGQAFNPRYMSVELPPLPPQLVTSEPEIQNTIENDNKIDSSAKRATYDTAFFADGDLVKNSEYPAWETDHVVYFKRKQHEAKLAKEKADKEKEKAAKLKAQNATTTVAPKIIKEDIPETKDAASMQRSIFFQKLTSKLELFKTRPWECESRITWLDLGLEYFPRYVRSVECVSDRCWYGHFLCQARSFTIKVLKRRKGACVKVSDNLAKIAAEELHANLTELWVWEELAIIFCCDCVLPY